MKVLFIANAISGDEPGLTGGEARFIEIGKIWTQLGYEIHLLSSPGGKELCERLGLRVIFHNFDQSQVGSRVIFIIRAIKSFFFLPGSLDDFNEGIIYSTNEMVYDVFPAFRLKLRYGKKIKWIVAVHWLPPFPPWKRKQSSIINSLLFFINERISLWIAHFFADALLPISTSTKNQLKAAGVNMRKAHSVECGVNFKKIRTIVEKINIKKYDGIFLKRLQSVKGIFDLINIWEKVIQSNPRAKLLIVGEGIDSDRAKEMVREKRLDKNITFTGMIYEFERKFRLIAQSKLLILPSYEENWAIVMGEAMACKIPVLAYDLPELVDVWKDSFIPIPLGNKKKFAEEITRHLDNKKLREKHAEIGYKYVQQFDWKKIAEREMQIMENI